MHHAFVGQRIGKIDGAASTIDFETADDPEHQFRRDRMVSAASSLRSSGGLPSCVSVPLVTT